MAIPALPVEEHPRFLTNQTKSKLGSFFNENIQSFWVHDKVSWYMIRSYSGKGRVI
jgi:hypothetical protein